MGVTRAVLVFLTCLGWARLASAATIVIPPVEVSSLAHTYLEFVPLPAGSWHSTSGVAFPSGPGTFTSSGFSAAIAQNDQIVVRFQAPAGKRFNVRTPFDASVELVFRAHWQTSGGGMVNVTDPGSVTWVGLEGVAPTRNVALNGVSNNGQVVGVNNRFDVASEFSFEAVEFTFPVTNSVSVQLRNYQSVRSDELPSFYSRASSSAATQPTIAMYLGTATPEVIVAPPVVITDVGHQFSPSESQVLDGVVWPTGLGAFSWSGLSATVDVGDQVAVRFEAPAGMRFRVRVPNGSNSNGFGVNAILEGSSGGNPLVFVEGTVTWFDLIGAAPEQYQVGDWFDNGGSTIHLNHDFNVTAPFEFAAVEVRLPVVVPPSVGPHEYSTLDSESSPSFYASCRDAAYDNMVVMDLVSIVPETVHVPAVEITELEHFYFTNQDDGNGNFYNVASDGVFPDGSGSAAGAGFMASLGRGDEVVTRFQAPPGHRFRVNAPALATSNQLTIGAGWRTATSDGVYGNAAMAPTVSWIGLIGQAPSIAPDGQFMSVSGGGQQLAVLRIFDVTQAFEFEAIEIRGQITNDEVANWDRAYGSAGAVLGGDQLSFVVQALGPAIGDEVVLELVPIAPPDCPGDSNGDNAVNGADLSVMLGQFGQNVSPGTGADANGDGIVNGADLSVLLSNFGTAC